MHQYLLTCKKGKAFIANNIQHTGEAEVEFHSFLTLAQTGAEWLTSRPSHFTPPPSSGGKYPITQWIWWVLEPFLMFWKTEKSLVPIRIWRMNCQPVASSLHSTCYPDSSTYMYDTYICHVICAIDTLNWKTLGYAITVKLQDIFYCKWPTLCKKTLYCHDWF